MDCDTTGIEPDFALVKFKKLAGGGYFKIVNQSVEAGAAPPRLHATSRSPRSKRTPRAPSTLDEAPAHQPRDAQGQGLRRRGARAASKPRLPGAFELPFVFNKFVLGEEFCKEKLGMTDEQLDDWNFSILRDGLGFTHAADRRSVRRTSAAA